MVCSRIRTLLIISVFCLISPFAQAVGFGAIKLYSYMNEPLDAEIELIGTQDIDLDNVTAMLAPPKDFQTVKLARPFFLSKLRFEIIQDEGNPYIRVYTKDLVKEPFLEFLVVLNWSEGRLVKGYKLLFDPAPLNSVARRSHRTTPTEAPLYAQNQTIVENMKQRMSYSGPALKPRRTQNLAQADGNPVVKLEGWSHDRPYGMLEQLFEPEEELGEDKKPFIERSPAVSVQPMKKTHTVAEIQPKPIPSVTEELPIVPQSTVTIDKRTLWWGGFAIIGLVLCVMGVVLFKKRKRQQPKPRRIQKASFVPEATESGVIDEEYRIRMDLAENYLKIQDHASAHQVLEDMLTYGNAFEKKQAQALIEKISILSPVSEKIVSH